MCSCASATIKNACISAIAVRRTRAANDKLAGAHSYDCLPAACRMCPSEFVHATCHDACGYCRKYNVRGFARIAFPQLYKAVYVQCKRLSCHFICQLCGCGLMSRHAFVKNKHLHRIFGSGCMWECKYTQHTCFRIRHPLSCTVSAYARIRRRMGAHERITCAHMVH